MSAQVVQENMMAMSGDWLAVAFAFLMGLSVLIYVILDGYDLGVGILMSRANDEQKDMMLSSIGPFWDANETWLVLGVGLLLVGFPKAQGEVLTSLYFPVAMMLICLVLRGVSYDFRAKVKAGHKHLWNKAFFIGSLGTSLAQGYMVGLYILGFSTTWKAHLFAALVAVCVAAAYSFIGACWLIMKTEGELQKKAVKAARIGLWVMALGIALVSIATPLVDPMIYKKWFSIPDILFLIPVPIITVGLILTLDRMLCKMPYEKDRYCWAPFVMAICIFVLCLSGLAFSFYPYIIPGQMTIYSAAAAHASLKFIFIGAVIVLPCILGYTIFSYRVFWGKVNDLRYY